MEARIMINDTNHIASLPFSDALKNKLNSYVASTAGKDPCQCGCSLLGCPDSVAITILSALSEDLGCKFKTFDFSDRIIEKPGDFAGFFTNVEEGSIVALFEVQKTAPALFPLLRDAVTDHRMPITIGKGPSARTLDLDLLPFRTFIVAEDRNTIPVELLESIYYTIDLTPERKELRRATVSSTLAKYGLSVNEGAAELIADRFVSDKDLLVQLFEIRNKAYAAGVTEITEDLLHGEKTGVTDICAVDNMDGREFELFTGNLLRNLGFSDVKVTPSSGDFGADVIAVKDDIRYAIQCKRYSAPVGVSAVQEVIASRSLHDCHVACVLTNSSFTPAAEELAKKNLVILWSRDKLKEFIERSNA